MKIVRTISELRAILTAERRAAGDLASVGFVPTMGALHEGHLSLVAAARAAHPIVVLSVFVNPTQFNESEDFDHYPRDEARDADLAQSAGVHVLFAPDVNEMYPSGDSTVVRVEGPLTQVLEGAARGSEHFDGVATVVTKLFHAVQPDAAYFGEKDYQQLLVVRRFTRDLHLPVQIVACPTLREHDGLARSSRNARLTAHERAQASAIPQAIAAVTEAAHSGQTDAAALRGLAKHLLEQAGLAIEYVSCVDPTTLEPVTSIGSGSLLMIAVRVGSTRLIDNHIIIPRDSVPPSER